VYKNNKQVFKDLQTTIQTKAQEVQPRSMEKFVQGMNNLQDRIIKSTDDVTDK
jgi:hypothetical protein